MLCLAIRLMCGVCTLYWCVLQVSVILSFAQAAKLKLKPPRFRSSGVDDTSFLGNVYISTFYQVRPPNHLSLCDFPGELMLVSTQPD